MMSRYIKSDFAKNVLTLMSGSILAQALPIAITPILTRMYSPEDFGVLALFVSIASIFGSIANARYEMAIVIPKSEKEALSLVVLGVIISITLSAVLFIIILLFHDIILSLLNNSDLSLWLYFVPLSVLAIGIFNSLNYYNTRAKKFKNIATSNILRASTLSFLNLSIGAFKNGPAGLVLGQFISYYVGNSRLLKTVLQQKGELKTIDIQDIKQVAKRYKRFPIYSMPAILSNVLSQNLTNIITSVLFSVKTLGFYSFTNKIMGAPSVLLGQSFGQVYMTEAAMQRQNTGNAIAVFNNTLKKLLFISVPVFIGLFFVIEDVFAFVFGAEWLIAGTYAKILIPLFWARFITAPLSVTNSVFEKQNISLYWQIGLLILSLGIYGIVYLYGLDFTLFLYIFSAALSVYYLFLLFLIRQVSKGDSDGK